MSSAVEQFASNISLKTFAQAAELRKRLLFVLLALVVYRIGTYIPLPGIDPEALFSLFDNAQSGIVGLFNMFSGGAVSRMAIFSLGIMPYISASIIMQLLSAVVPALEKIKKDGEHGRNVINQYTRYLTVVLCIFQSYAVIAVLESSPGLVLQPGLFFKVSSLLTLLGGTMFLIWLGEQITARGIGNGISLLIFAGIVAELPSALVSTLELGREGAISSAMLFFIFLLCLAVIFIIVFVEQSQRRLPIQYPKRQVRGYTYQGTSSFLPLKINVSGVIPPIFASSLLLIPATILGFMSQDTSSFLFTIGNFLAHGQPLYIFLYGFLIVFFSFFYASVVFSSEDTAENLRKHGGFLLGVRPGKNTACYIDHVLTRITVFGSLYLVAVCLLPEFLISATSLPFYFGGTSLLIVVGVSLDMISQIQGHLLTQQYRGLVERSRLTGRR